MAHELIGVAAISIDVAGLNDHARSPSRTSAVLFARLLNLLDDYEIAVTWAFPEPADMEMTGEILAAKVRHEIAILGDAAWIGEAAGRSVFACNLGRRIITAQAAGLTIRALACREACVPRSEYDLLVKHNIAVVRQPRFGSKAFADLQPRPLRHGVWDIPSTVEVPRAGAWWTAGAGGAKASIANAERGVAHVTMDLAVLAACDPRLRVANQVLRYVADARGREMIEIATLGLLGEKLAQPKQFASARSILRAA